MRECSPNFVYSTVLTIQQSTAFAGLTARRLSIYLIDIVKGSILYHAVHENVSPLHRVFLIQAENYIIYHFWSNGNLVKGDGKGFQVVVCDLYESEHKDERFER